MNTDEQEALEQAITALESQRGLLGDTVVETALGPLREKLAALRQAAAPTLQGERKVITIVLADVKGSTDLAERLPMETWVETMNRLFQLMETEVFRYGGSINQFRGDGLLAFFGAEAAHEDDPERGVLAALAMQDAVKAYAADLAQRTDWVIQLRVGVNTGEVILTDVGDPAHYSEGTAMGLAVSLTARLEAAAAPGTVLVSESTYRLTAPRFAWQPLDPIRVKGISEPLQVYRALAPLAAPGNLRGLIGMEAPLIGRTAELRALQAALARLDARQGGVATLVGEAGLGKSRLIRELRATDAAASVHWAEGRCASYRAANAYSLWRDLLSDILGIHRQSDPAAAGAALRAAFHAYPPARETAYACIAQHIIGAPVEPETKEILRPFKYEKLKAEIFAAVESLLLARMAAGPLALICEDLHWADPTSLELLNTLLPLTAQHPLLVIGALRPEPQHGCWRFRANATRYSHTDIVLAALSPAESAILIEQLLRVKALPDALQTRLLARAEGNPFYVEELIRELVNSQTLTREAGDGGLWRVTRDLTEIAIPETVQGVIQTRIDRLSPLPRRILQLASVIGRSFPRRVLANLAAEAEIASVALESHLQTLEREQMLEPLPAMEGEPQHTFKHHLTQEAAYHTLLEKDRRKIHAQVAETLKRLYPKRSPEYAALLAHHWEQAGEPQRAIPHLIQAGGQAQWSFANTEARAYLEHALNLAHAIQLNIAESDILEELSSICRAQADHHSAQVYLERALELNRRMGNRSREGRALDALGIVMRRQGKLRAARRYFEQALAIAQESNNWRDLAYALGNLGVVCRIQGDYLQAKMYHEQSLAHYRALHNVWGQGVALGNLGTLYRVLGAYEDAQKYYEQAQAFSRNPYSQGILRGEQARLQCAQRDYAAACVNAEQALHLAQEIGDLSGMGYNATVLADARLGLGDLDGAAAAYQQAIAQHRQLHEEHLTPAPLLGLARIAWLRGDLEQARAQLEAFLEQSAAANSERSPDLLWIAYQVSQVTDASRAAALIEEAHTVLQKRAASLPDVLRETYLAQATHRNVLAAWEAVNASHGKSNL